MRSKVVSLLLAVSVLYAFTAAPAAGHDAGYAWRKLQTSEYTTSWSARTAWMGSSHYTCNLRYDIQVGITYSYLTRTQMYINSIRVNYYLKPGPVLLGGNMYMWDNGSYKVDSFAEFNSSYSYNPATRNSEGYSYAGGRTFQVGKWFYPLDGFELHKFNYVNHYINDSCSDISRFYIYTQ